MSGVATPSQYAPAFLNSLPPIGTVWQLPNQLVFGDCLTLGPSQTGSRLLEGPYWNVFDTRLLYVYANNACLCGDLGTRNLKEVQFVFCIFTMQYVNST